MATKKSSMASSTGRSSSSKNKAAAKRVTASTSGSGRATAKGPSSRSAKSTRVKTSPSGTASRSTGKGSDKLNAADRKKLRGSDYGLQDIREYPMPDAQHVHAAEAYFRYAPKGREAELARRIMTKAKKYGVDVESQTIRDWAKKY